MGFGKKILVGLVVLAVCGLSLTALSQSYDPTEDLPRPTTAQKVFNKLGRGFSNVLFGWAEIPMTFDRGVKQGRPLTYLLGVTPVLGTARAVIRTSTGVFEVTTFPFTDQDVNYEAILEPEYIF